jgi:ferritin-like metal-binding protein YciE
MKAVKDREYYCYRDYMRLQELGVPMEGICLYPILNHPGWDDGRHCHNGWWDYADALGQRPIHEPLANNVRAASALHETIPQENLSGDDIASTSIPKHSFLPWPLNAIWLTHPGSQAISLQVACADMRAALSERANHRQFRNISWILLKFKWAQIRLWRHRKTNLTDHTDRKIMSTENEIIDWLRDAYAMERALELSLKKQSENKEHSPEVRKGAAKHLKETQGHAEAVKQVLEALGSDTSTIKTGLGLMAEAIKGMGTKFAKDERVKDLLAAYASEHFEIACYTALAVAAEQADLPEVVELCEEIIPEEEKMAQALGEALPRVVEGYLKAAAKT